MLRYIAVRSDTGKAAGGQQHISIQKSKQAQEDEGRAALAFKLLPDNIFGFETTSSTEGRTSAPRLRLLAAALEVQPATVGGKLAGLVIAQHIRR